MVGWFTLGAVTVTLLAAGAVLALWIRSDRRYAQQQERIDHLQAQVDAAAGIDAIMERARRGLPPEPQSHRRRHLRAIDGGAAGVAALLLGVLGWLRGHRAALAGTTAAVTAGAVTLGALWVGPQPGRLDNGAMVPVPPARPGPVEPAPQPPMSPTPTPVPSPDPPPTDTPSDEQPPTWTPPATDQPAGDSGDGGNGGELPDPDPTDPPRSPTPPEPPDDPPTTPAPDPPAENGDEWHLLCLEVGLLGLPEVCLL